MKGRSSTRFSRYLFVCSQNRLRSPTAEQVFADYPGIEVASAGTSHGADVPLSSELVEWADVIVVMEKSHRTRVRTRHRKQLAGKKLVCLDIPDDYAFMDDGLVRLLKAKMRTFLPVAR